jgi:hypothetical protein
MAEVFASLLGDSPVHIERSTLKGIVLELFRRHENSAGRTAEVLGLDEHAFIQCAESLGIPSLDNPPED